MMKKLDRNRRNRNLDFRRREDAMRQNAATIAGWCACCISIAVLVGCGGGDEVVYVQPDSGTEQANAAQNEPQTDLTEREVELAQREAEVAAREAEVAQREQPPAPAQQPSAPAQQPPTPVAAAPTATPTPLPTPTPAPIPVTVAPGTLVTVEFIDKLSSHESTEGQEFTARVIEPVRVPQGIAIPTGSVVTGKVTEAKPAKKIGGSSRLNVEFTSIRLPAGDSAPFHAAFSTKGKSATGRDVGIIAGAAAGGAILGNQVIDDDGGTKGALIGAAAGAVAASQTRAKPVEIAAGTVTNLELIDPIDLEIRP
jgi:type IV secretory pathway VirB10-like protein